MSLPLARYPRQSEVTAVPAGPAISNSREKSNSIISDSDEGIASEGLVDLVLEIGRERQRIMEAMKAALLRGDDDAALEYVRQLTGLPTTRTTHPSPSTQVRH